MILTIKLSKIDETNESVKQKLPKNHFPMKRNDKFWAVICFWMLFLIIQNNSRLYKDAL